MPIPCKACGEPIDFILTPKGRRLPVNPELETVRMACPSGTGERVTVVLEDGQVIRGFRSAPGARMMTTVTGYIPHWDTCPHAEEFRRK